VTGQKKPVGVREALAEIRTDAELARYGGDPLAKLRADNIRTYLEHEAVKLGTEEQGKRYSQGRLPEEEILALARAALFAPFNAFERWSLSHEKPKMIRQVRHAVGCVPEQREYEHVVNSFATDLTAVEEQNLAALRAGVEVAVMHPWIVNTGGSVAVSVLTHWISCTTCDGDYARTSAKVTVSWGERELVREYAL
jgi:hypothetical protein